MNAKERLEQISTLVNKRGYISVGELSQTFHVSEMTIRRDLDHLEKENRLRRTFGGAASPASQSILEIEDNLETSRPDTSLVERIDVLVATSVNPEYDSFLHETVSKKQIPIIAESLTVHNEYTVVAVDNFQAAREVGRYASQHANRNWDGKAYALDLTYSLANTQARSRGFTAGLKEIIPDAEIVLSINAQSRSAVAYQLTRDALTVYKQINIIFAINDTTAWGAIQACRDLSIDPQKILVIPFGLEGDKLKNALMEGNYCQFGLAMFPEIVGPVCVEAAIDAYNHIALPHDIFTPYAILTAETLPELYKRREDRWEICWDIVRSRFQLPLDICPEKPCTTEQRPRRIGLVIPFSEHEWYQNLFVSMNSYTNRLGIRLEMIDAEQNLKEEVEMRRRAIARVAADYVQDGDVVLIDGGLIANHLAEMLSTRKGITIITNSIEVFNILSDNEENILMLTGGAYRHSSKMLVGPTAEGSLRELRGDKLFLIVSGISIDFGLWHTNISEVTMKQAMIRSAREVILLADHTLFGQESVAQIAPLSVVNKLITDDVLPASIRLNLTKMGIQIIIAND